MRSRFTKVIALAAVVAGCTSTLTGPDPLAAEYVEEIATVRAAGGGSFFLVVASAPDAPLVPYPEPLSDAFRRDGLRVVFSGERLPIPPYVRLIGLPVHVTDIRKVER